jgi:hypothetical protein
MAENCDGLHRPDVCHRYCRADAEFPRSNRVADTCAKRRHSPYRRMHKHGIRNLGNTRRPGRRCSQRHLPDIDSLFAQEGHGQWSCSDCCTGRCFPLAFLWHTQWFKAQYDALHIYRADLIIPFGFASMVIQGLVFSWAFPRLFPDRGSAWLGNGLRYTLGLFVIVWTYTTLSVGAKHVMTSVSSFVTVETAFTLIQFLITAPLIAWAWRKAA